MEQKVARILHSLCQEMDSEQPLFFASNSLPPPQYSQQVPVPRLTLVLAGEHITQVANGNQTQVELHLKQRQVLYLPPDSWDLANWQSNSHLLTIILGPRYIVFQLISPHETHQAVRKLEQCYVERCVMESIHYITASLNQRSTQGAATKVDYHLVSALMGECAEKLAQYPLQSTSRPELLYERICHYIDHHHHLNLNRTQVAKQFNISVNHLSRIYSLHGGHSFAEYLTQTRLNHAKQLLLNIEQTTCTIAKQCGFKDSNYFYKVFKAHVGCTPKEYRMHQQREALQWHP